MSEGSKGLRLYNTLTRSKEDFVPIDANNVRMYVCGPTVYDYAHIGNARPAIVFDVLYRLLRHLYGADHVTYVRNITDVDDKINARALRDFGAEIDAGNLSLNEAIRKVTEPTYDQYQKDVSALGCLPPTYQPRATEFVQPREDGKADMITLIERLIARGHAYETNGEVLFDTASMSDYGQLSKRNLDEQQAGARIAVDAHKKNPQDFVLWKLSSQGEPGWDSPWGRGRPGWHIECSAMSEAYLGQVFDIHGGGLDLIFPHHENEIAQSRCAHGTHAMANVWMHNGFLQVEGRKMSKSDGNFHTIHELLETEKVGGRKWPGEVLRLAMLMTHYREPIDFSVRRLEEAERLLASWRRSLSGDVRSIFGEPNEEAVAALRDDLDTYSVVQKIDRLARETTTEEGLERFSSTLGLAGLLPSRVQALYDETEPKFRQTPSVIKTGIISAQFLARRFKEIALESISLSEDQIDALSDQRLAFIAAKNWPEADRIRDELLAQGIQLKDGKHPVTGERVTTWEVKR